MYPCVRTSGVVLALFAVYCVCEEKCGGIIQETQGTIQTPNFPNPFNVPIRCRWVIDASQHTTREDASIVVYFTQLFVSTGLKFTEFDFYEANSLFQLGGRPIHEVTEQNVTSVQWLRTRRQFLVIDFSLDRLEGNHLRALDDLLHVYGFNMTFETGVPVRDYSCSVVACSLAGHCYASHDYTEYWCSCFPGFSGTDCGHGPLCQPSRNICENGATCRHAGATAVLCNCPEGYTGSKCDIVIPEQGCGSEEPCTTQCPDDGTHSLCNCGDQRTPVELDRARYEGTVRVMDVNTVRQCLANYTNCSLKATLEKQLAKYLRSSRLSKIEDLRVINISFGAEVRFHFWGGKKDGSRVRESLNRLVQQGRLGNISLVTTHLAVTQEPTLLLQNVVMNQPRQVVRQGDEFILSCIAQGSSHMTFCWFKDGVFINVTNSQRNMWTQLLPLDSSEQYTAILGIEHAYPLDRGRYTCQVSDWGYQQCKSIVLEVMEAPLLKVVPMSITLEKGENVTITCTSPNELQHETRFGYSWTKNNFLLKMIPGQEFWEDLYPGGSILTVNNVQKSAVYMCHIHGSVASVAASVRVEVLNHSIVPWCPVDEDGVGGVRWEKSGPGVLAKVECPVQYSGIASRLCLLVDHDQARWQTPDYSDCVSDKLALIANNLRKLTLGYGNTTALETVTGILGLLRDRGVIYPGEGEPAITVLHSVLSYLNMSASWEDLINTTSFFYSTVNALLKHRNAIINHQKVEELQTVVNDWAFLWGLHAGPNFVHYAYDTLAVDMVSSDITNIHNSFTVHLPHPTQSYPAWYSSKVSLHVEGNITLQNSTFRIAVVTYNKLTQFLPQRYSQKLENGSELQYELASNVVSIVVSGPLKAVAEVELASTGRPGWDLRCGVAVTPSSPWNLTHCQITLLPSNRTQCACPQLGTYAAVIVKQSIMSQSISKNGSVEVVLVGCVCCLVQSLLTLGLLLLRWWHHRTCLLYLKLQCCTATAASMAVFLYATSHTAPPNVYKYISTSLQALILVGMSSHISKVLLIYTEIIPLPKIAYIKQTIICIITGVPLLIVLCNHVAQAAVGGKLQSWWLAHDTMVFYSCICCGLLLLILFTFLYINVSTHLMVLISNKNTDANKAILRRIGLLKRAAVIFISTISMAAASILYVNIPGSKCQYVFSFSCAFLGFVLILCYVLHCESPLHLQVLRSLKLESTDQGYISESDSSPLSFFTKQDPEAESESVPVACINKIIETEVSSVLCEGRDEVYTNDTEMTKTPTKTKTVTFHNDLVTVSNKSETTDDEVNLEIYPSSPRKLRQINDQGESKQSVTETTQESQPTQEVATTRVCVITSVVVDTPSVVVCSVDVEPCVTTVLGTVSPPIMYKTKDNSSIPQKLDVSEIKTDNSIKSDSCNDSGNDVMDRICHDLDYLLNRDISCESNLPHRNYKKDNDSYNNTDLEYR